MKLIRKIEDQTGKEIKELYHEFIDLPKPIRIAIDLSIIFVLLLALVLITPTLKYTLLNAFGTAEAKIKVVDSKAGTPILEAKVTAGQGSYLTDENGIATISQQPFGKLSLAIEKPGYDKAKEEVVLTSEFNAFEMPIDSNGKRVLVEAKQYLSNKRVDKFIVRTTGDKNLSSVATNGRAIVVIPDETTLELGAEISSENFQSQNFELNAREENVTNRLTLIPNGNHYFLASRGGATTIYRSSLDGSGQERYVEPAGFEDGSSKLYISPSGEYAVYEATRRPDGGKRQLYSLNLRTKQVSEFDRGAKSWKILSVTDKDAVYIYSKENPANNKNQTLKTYNFATGEVKELITSREMSMPTSVNGYTIFAELIERGSYPGGYLLRQLLAVNEFNGEIKKISQDATITNIRQVTPTKVQYTQLNPTNGAEVLFVFDTITSQVSQAAFGRSDKSMLMSPANSNIFAWTEGSTRLSFGDSDVEVTKSYLYNHSNLKPTRWISADYLVLSGQGSKAGQNSLLVRVDNGKTGILP